MPEQSEKIESVALIIGAPVQYLADTHRVLPAIILSVLDADRGIVDLIVFTENGRINVQRKVEYSTEKTNCWRSL